VARSTTLLRIRALSKPCRGGVTAVSARSNRQLRSTAQIRGRLEPRQASRLPRGGSDGPRS
jgi:hypothetical protein